MRALLSAFQYEFLMQVRRPTVWILQLLLSLTVVTGLANPWNMPPDMVPQHIFGNWASVIALLMPLGFGLVLADRLVRDRRLRTDDLLTTFPTPFWIRLVGKYLGAAVATMMPILCVYVFGVGYVLVYFDHALLSVVGWAAYAFATVILPGLLFVAAFSVGCPLVMPIPLYQVLFVGYWFWGNMVNPEWMFTLSGTLLTPSGPFMVVAFFQTAGVHVTEATVTQALASIALLLSLGGLAFWTAHAVWKWQQQQA